MVKQQRRVVMNEKLRRLVRVLRKWSENLRRAFGWRSSEPLTGPEATDAGLDRNRDPAWRELTLSIWP
jgi:hypothetical protein